MPFAHTYLFFIGGLTFTDSLIGYRVSACEHYSSNMLDSPERLLEVSQPTQRQKNSSVLFHVWSHMYRLGKNTIISRWKNFISYIRATV